MTGIHPRLTGDAWRGASALATAFLNDDYEGQGVMLDHATPAELAGIASAAVAMSAGVLVYAARLAGVQDPAGFAERMLAGGVRAALEDAAPDL